MNNEKKPEEYQRAPKGTCSRPFPDGSYSNKGIEGKWDAYEPPKDDLPSPKRFGRKPEDGLEGAI